MRGRRIASLCGALLAAWLAGFAWFIAAGMHRAAPVAQADGIVALTGGADRIAAALRLLQQGKARMLLISGVGPGASLASLARECAIDPASLPNSITLGRRATTTLGNATETAEWAGRNGLHSLIVVTAFYHMPRALIELGRALPGTTLYPAPVTPGTLWLGPGYGLRLLAEEYAKFLVSAAGLTRSGDPPGPA